MNSPFLSKIHNEYTTSRLIICFSFFLPISTSATSVLSCFIFLSWLFDSNFEHKFNEIKSNQFVLGVMAYLAVFIIALLWAEDMHHGLYTLKKQWKFVLLPILITAVRKEHFKLYIGSFIAAMSLSALASIPIFFGFFSTKHGYHLDPTPFMTRIDYAPFLALATFIVMESFLYRLQGKQRLAAAGIAILMTFNLFVCQGRTGQVVFIVLTVVTFFQYFKENLFKAAAISTTCIIIALFGAYNLSNNFQMRIDQSYSDFSDFGSKPDTSIGQRLTFAINTWELISDNFLVGVGTGDFKKKYQEINMKRSPAFPNTNDPHNHYLYVLAQFGLFGLAAFLSIFYFQLQFWNRTKDKNQRLRLGLTVFFLTIMFAGSYLIHHHATLLFVLMSSLLFKKWAPEESDRLPDVNT